MNCSQSSYNFLPKERNSNMDNYLKILYNRN